MLGMGLIAGALAAEIVVVADRTETPAVDAPRAVTVLEAADVAERQARTLPDALREAAAVTVQETNRGSGSPYLRGLVGPQNLLVIDGLPVLLSTWRTGPNQYLALFDPAAAERLEIVRGPASVSYGNGAMGGVIHLVLRDTEPTGDGFAARTHARAGFASADVSGSGAGEVGLAWRNLSWTFGGAFAGFGALRTGGDAIEPRSAFRQGFGRTRLVWTPGAGHRVSVTWLGGTVEDASRLDGVATGEVRAYDNTDHLVWAAWRHDGSGALVRAEARVGWHRALEVQRRTGCELAADRPADLDACLTLARSTVTKRSLRTDQVDALVANADVELGWFARRLRLQVGGDAQHEGVASLRRDRTPGDGLGWVERDRGSFADGSTFTTLGAFSSLDGVPVRLASGRGELHLTAGARVTHVAATSPDVPQPDAAGAVVSAPLSYANTAAVGSGGLQWRDPGRWSAFLSFVQGFRAPNLEETTLLGPEENAFSVPNPGLRPERSDTIEGGLKLDRPFLTGQLVGWGTWIADAIVDAPTTVAGAPESADGLPYTWRENRAGARYVGVEGDLAARWRALTVSGHVAWTWGEVDGPDGPVPARRVPPLSGRVGARWDAPDDRGHVELFGQFAVTQARLSPGDLDDTRICAPDRFVAATFADLGRACPGTPGWGTLNLRGSARLVGDLRLDLALLNLTDVRYRTHGSGIDSAGFDARVALRTGW